METEAAISNITDKLQEWADQIIVMLPNVVLAVFIVLIAWLAARLARKGATKVLTRVTPYKQVNWLLSTAAYISVLAIGTFIALDVLELEKAVTSLLAGAGIVGLALGFAFQDIASNFMSGILISFRRPFKHGDIVETNGFSGSVHDVNLRSTVVRTFQGQNVIIPNKDVYQNPLTNYSKTGKRRIDLACGVAYGDDLAVAQKTAVEAIESLSERDSDRNVEFFYTDFGGSSVDFQVRFWIDFEKQTDYLKAQSEAIKQLKNAFDEKGLTIPFPIRTLDFGVVGGERLAEALPAALTDGRNGMASEEK
ncbi:MAG: mechanosensitive ion channel [Rhodothermia bacterium]|nr:mechanosensitive ion channel [Rhodothermia bacterium]